jgi:signal transduction histidine kinase
VPGETLFDELKRYVGFDADDEGRLRALGPRVEDRIDRITADFYDHILRHPGAGRAITGGHAQVERLRGTLGEWLRGLFTGPWDDAYYERRARIGRRHVEIDLPQQYMFAAVNVVRGHLADAVLDTAPDLAAARAELHAVDKLLDLELAIMLHTFREHYRLQVQRSERLATFGQLVASIGHELRKPLAVMESSVFLLRSRFGAIEGASKQLDRIANQIRLSDQIVTDLLDMIRDVPAQREPVDAVDVARAAADAVPRPPGARLTVEATPALPRIEVDPVQLRQILVNLLSNGFEAAGPGGEVRLAVRTDGGDVDLVVADSGPGLDPAVRGRLFEPLVTTKARGIGLGLALVKRIVERHGGTIGYDPREKGARFVVRLPRAA